MPNFNQLTEREQDIYGFIKDKIEERGYGPTVREIGDGFQIKSPNGVMCHLKALETKGLIKRDGFRARAIQLASRERQEIERQRDEEIEDLRGKLAELLRCREAPAACPRCGSLDYPVCPKCRDTRA